MLGFVGCTLGPEEAYRFARGEEVTSSGGLRAKLVRPLDFLVVADHAEYYGVATQLIDGDPASTRRSDRQALVRHVPRLTRRGFNVFQEIVQGTERRPAQESLSPARP